MFDFSYQHNHYDNYSCNRNLWKNPTYGRGNYIRPRHGL